MKDKTYTAIEIANYICEKYHNGVELAVLTIMDDDDLIKFCEDFFYFEKLGWCGCGCPMVAKKCIRDFLDIIDRAEEVGDLKTMLKNRFGIGLIYDDERLLCLAYTLNSAGFLEHGSGIGWSWLTEEGEMFLYILKTDGELLEAEND